MEHHNSLLNNLYSNTGDFINLKIKAVKLEFYERSTNLISGALNSAILVIIGLFALLFVSVGLAFWLSEVFKSNIAGFLAVGGIYLLTLFTYLLISSKKENRKLKNVILKKVSGNLNDYELMLEARKVLDQQLTESETTLKTNLEEVKTTINTAIGDYERIKSQFIPEEGAAGGKLPRALITSSIDFILNTFVLKNSGIVTRAIIPLITKALATSAIFKEKKKTSLVENLKLKFSKFL